MSSENYCIYCNDPVDPRRWELGYYYCMKRDCLSTNGVTGRENYRLMLVPKQGFTIVHKDSPDLKNGRSSGRS